MQAHHAAAPASPARGYALAAACAACFGCALTVGRHLGGDLHRFTFLAVMFVIATVLLLGLHVARHRCLPPLLGRSAAWLLAIQVGIAFFGMWALWTAVPLLDPAVGAFINRTEALFSIAIAVVVLSERLVPGEVLGGVIVLAGLGVVHAAGVEGLAAGTFETGFWLMLGGAALMGLSEICSKLAVRTTTPLAFAFYRALALAVVFLAAGGLTGNLVAPTAAQLGWTALIALLAPCTARSLFLASMRHLDLTKSVLVNLSQPVFAATLAWAWLGMLPTGGQWAGGALILLGCAALVWFRPASSLPAEAAADPVDAAGP